MRSIDNATPIRGAVCKAYDKLPEDTPTLLVINDDLSCPILEPLSTLTEEPSNLAWDFIAQALYYEPLKPPYCDTTPLGCFMTSKYEHLSGTLFLNVHNTGQMEYRCALARNPYALQSIPETLINRVRGFGPVIMGCNSKNSTQ